MAENTLNLYFFPTSKGPKDSPNREKPSKFLMHSVTIFHLEK